MILGSKRMLKKMTRLALMLLTVPGLLTALAVPSAAQSGSTVFRKGEVIVELKPGTSIDNVNARIGTTTIQRIYGTNFYRLATPKNKKENKFKKRLSNDPDVLSATLNPVVTSPLSVFGRSTFSLPDGHPTPGQTRPQYLSQQLIDDLDAVHLRS